VPRNGSAWGLGARRVPVGQIPGMLDARFELVPLPVPVLEPSTEGNWRAAMARRSMPAGHRLVDHPETLTRHGREGFGVVRHWRSGTLRDRDYRARVRGHPGVRRRRRLAPAWP